MSDPEETLPFVRLFTDGACKGNPGPGGWGCILRHPASATEKEFSGGEPDTTNNKMEMQAVIEGLQQLTRRTKVDIVTDSKYVADGCRTWVAGWKRNGWRRKRGNTYLPVKNVDLWKLLDSLVQKHDVQFTVVKGHAGHTENERCDELAVAAAEEMRHRS